MKTKEEVIKEKYVELIGKELFNEVKDNISSFGYIYKYSLPIERDNLDISGFEWLDNSLRPKSLNGIETNNSWIRIESEADLPICEELHLYNIKDKKYYRGVLCGNDGRLDYYATHYAPIEKKESPLHS